jgi:hypothetical protein
MPVWPLVLLLSFQDMKNQEPLLVVVEASAREVVKGDSLRDAIARELGVRVLSPAEDAPAAGVPIMTVVLSPDRAVVVYRRGDVTIRRAVQLPADGQQRLQLVTWLAGNVVRDQTAELLHHPEADEPTQEPSEAVSESPPDQPADRSPQPPLPPPAPMVSPPPMAQPVAVVTPATSASAPIASGPKQWTVAVHIGQGILDSDHIKCNCGTIWSDLGAAFEVDVARSGPAFAIGGTLFKARGRAGGLTMGWHRRPRPWLAPEVTATLGLWSIENPSAPDTADLFVRLAAGLAVSPTSWFDVVARLTVITPMSNNLYLGYATIGLRYRLPF